MGRLNAGRSSRGTSSGFPGRKTLARRHGDDIDERHRAAAGCQRERRGLARASRRQPVRKMSIIAGGEGAERRYSWPPDASLRAAHPRQRDRACRDPSRGRASRLEQLRHQPRSTTSPARSREFAGAILTAAPGSCWTGRSSGRLASTYASPRRERTRRHGNHGIGARLYRPHKELDLGARRTGLDGALGPQAALQAARRSRRSDLLNDGGNGDDLAGVFWLADGEAVWQQLTAFPQSPEPAKR